MFRKQVIGTTLDDLKSRRNTASSPTTGSENYVPYLERLTPKQREKLKRGMRKLGQRFRNRNKFWPRLIRAIRSF